MLGSVFDIVVLLFDYINSSEDLHNASLVNRMFNRIATPLLYRHIRCPKAHSGKLHPIFAIATHPELAKYVRTLEEDGQHLICSANSALCSDLAAEGYRDSDTKKRKSRALRRLSGLCFPNKKDFSLRHGASIDDDIIETAATVVPLMVNLEKFIWHGQANRGLWSSLVALRNAPNLKEISFDFHPRWTSEEWDTLATLPKLQRIAVACDSRELCERWFSLQKSTITHLTFTWMPPDNLHEIIAHLPHLKSLVLPNYRAQSLLAVDLARICPQLEHLDIALDNHVRPPPPISPFSTLRRLIITYRGDESEASDLHRWVHGLASTSPLEYLEIKGSSLYRASDRMIESIVGHRLTLRSVIIPRLKVDDDQWKRLCTCENLETLACAVSPSSTPVYSLPRNSNIKEISLYVVGRGEAPTGFAYARDTNLRIDPERHLRSIIIHDQTLHSTFTGCWTLDQRSLRPRFKVLTTFYNDKTGASW